MTGRWWVAVVGTVTLLAIAATSLWYAAGPASGTGLTLKPGMTLYRAPDGRVTAAGHGPTGLSCDRFAAAGGTALCLVSTPPTAAAIVLDRRLNQVRRIQIPGIPSRARVSASGRMLAWTTFVTGHSYRDGSGFSTATGILDLRTGHLVTDVESIRLSLGGRRYHAPDVNYWGVTFAADDNRFYATVATKGRTYLVEGDVGRWRARTIREGVECPSLSPDGTRLAFKKRVGDGWRLTVLDLGTLTETRLAERGSVDDQALWLDDRTVAYGRAGGVWTVPADGSGSPRLLVPRASSPART